MTSVATVNFTSSIDRVLLKRAKVVAAKADTSVNALFNSELRYLVETYEAAEKAELKTLQACSIFLWVRRTAPRP